ncbi:auxin efflux carrier [Chlamydoabsidia padenii]|nr:auxin efflux carrier [Chlamydoabsidia padenii]
MPMLELVLSALQAILQVIVVAGFGVILTKTGYIDSSKQKWLSSLNLHFFTPCLLFVNIASVITLEKLVEFWPIPVFFVVFTCISWTVSQVVIRVFGVRGIHRHFVVACSLFCNTNSLPFAIISSLAYSEASRILYWRADDTQQDIAMRGIAYTIFYGMFCNIIQWSYGYHLLQPTEHETPRKKERHPSDASTMGTNDLIYVQQKDTQWQASPLVTPNETTPLLPTTHPLSPVPPSRLKCMMLACHSVMSPPLYAAFLALVIGLSPIQPLLFNKHAFLYPSVTLAIEACGKLAVPLILICLGSQLTFITQQGGTTSSRLARQAVLASVVTRMIICPLLVLITVMACLTYTKLTLLQDPIFVVTLILLGCAPTAINLSQITQVSGCFEQEMMYVLFWSYGVVCVPIMTAIVSLALHLVDKWLV